jgi:dipeptidyl aminopeptidase/acylaminoacyl peptidase
MRTRVILVTILVLVHLRPAVAQDRYVDPPAPIARILDQPLPPIASLGPDREWLLVQSRPALPPIAEVAAPDLRLAGFRIDPRTNGPSRSQLFTRYVLRAVYGDVERGVQTPPGARLGQVSWAPDGARFSFAVTADQGIELWVGETATGATRRLTGPVLNGTMGSPCVWMPDATRLICRMVPEARGEPPSRATVPSGPVTQESQGRSAPNRTYQDLLESPADEALFDHYFTNRIAFVGLDGVVTPIAEPGVHSSVEPSPDGRYLFVATVHRPYSYLVPSSRFPIRLEVWDPTGKVVRLVADRPPQDEVSPSFDAVPTGPRNVAWRADAPATLVWVEALDGGDPRRQARHRDQVLALAAPFTGEPNRLHAVEWRVNGLLWGPSGLALVSEDWNRTSRTRTWLLRTGEAPRVLFDRSSEDRYGHPGAFLTVPAPGGTRVVQTSADGRRAYLAGDGASPEGDRPFLDELDLMTGKATRLWRSEAPYYEQVTALLDPVRRQVLTLRESVDAPPNYLVRDLRRNRTTQLTAFSDPAPEFKGVTKELITYRRGDGVQLSATLYLPAGYEKSKGPLPFLFWAYPREFRSADAAAQVIGSPYRFTRPTGASHLFLLLAGYGVLDNPTMPIVAKDGGEPNDNYVEQLVASAEAAVNKVVGLGVADRHRIGIGGHSYGAFMTANLLAHSDVFQAGIARSGAYNRTLTPFGFQAEERTYWEAQETYTGMSPFTFANRVKEPILLIHGQDDDNSGTFPIQSERMYAALKGHGATVRLVWLPAEAHGYRARESVGHTLREMIDWMDRWVKTAGPKQVTP